MHNSNFKNVISGHKIRDEPENKRELKGTLTIKELVTLFSENESSNINLLETLTLTIYELLLSQNHRKINLNQDFLQNICRDLLGINFQSKVQERLVPQVKWIKRFLQRNQIKPLPNGRFPVLGCEI